MKWTNDRADNVDDRRGSGGGGMLVGGGLGTLIIAAIIFFLGGDPSAILSNGVGNAPQTEQRELTAEELQVKEFVRMLSAENNQTWTKIFSENGMQYREPKNCTLRKCNAIWLRNCTSCDGTILLPCR